MGRPKTRRCAGCGEAVTSSAVNRKYCTPTCGKRHYDRLRRREERLTLKGRLAAPPGRRYPEHLIEARIEELAARAALKLPLFP